MEESVRTLPERIPLRSEDPLHEYGFNKLKRTGSGAIFQTLMVVSLENLITLIKKKKNNNERMV